MVEGRKEPGFLLQPRDPLGVVGKTGRKELERHPAAEPRVLGQVDLAHPAGTELAQHLVVAEELTGHSHTVTGYSFPLRLSLLSSAELSILSPILGQG